LRRTLAEQDARARAATERETEREARELRQALAHADALAATPEHTRFVLRAGDVVVPDDLGTLEPVDADPCSGLDVIAAERVRRAAQGDAKAALAELAPLFADPAVPVSCRAHLRALAAWHAHRGGLGAERDAILAEVGESSAWARASGLLLRVVRDGVLGDEEPALALIAALSPARAGALCAGLAAHGIDDRELRARAADAQERRCLLRRVRDLAPALSAATAPVVRAAGDGLVLFQPSTSRGALLARAQTLALCAVLAGPRVVVPPFPAPALVVVDDAVALLPPRPEAAGWFSGTTATAALIVALALLCGTGSLFAFRAWRREEDALRARTEFLTLVTHELKTPLAGVRLVGELLADGHVTDPGERAAWLARLNAEVARLGLLLENVLDLGRLQRGERAHAPAPIDAAAFARDTLALFAPLLERDGFAVHLRAPAPVVVAADAAALRQALLNLLDNARKYGKSPIEVAVDADGVHARVSVRDHGDGVPVRERDAVFARFARGAQHRHGAIPGVGLGLHLARAIAQRHGGTLTYRDAEGGGACFELRLPREQHA
jgi:signal transduction histidine kinase